MQDAGEEAKNNPEIVLEALKYDGNALQYASEELRNNPEIVLEAIKQDEFKEDSEYSWKYASEELRNNSDFLMRAMRAGACFNTQDLMSNIIYFEDKEPWLNQLMNRVVGSGEYTDAVYGVKEEKDSFSDGTTDSRRVYEINAVKGGKEISLRYKEPGNYGKDIFYYDGMLDEHTTIYRECSTWTDEYNDGSVDDRTAGYCSVEYQDGPTTVSFANHHDGGIWVPEYTYLEDGVDELLQLKDIIHSGETDLSISKKLSNGYELSVSNFEGYDNVYQVDICDATGKRLASATRNGHIENKLTTEQKEYWDKMADKVDDFKDKHNIYENFDLTDEYIEVCFELLSLDETRKLSNDELHDLELMAKRELSSSYDITNPTQKRERGKFTLDNIAQGLRAHEKEQSAEYGE